MRKTLGLISQNPELAAKMKLISEMKERFLEREKFLAAQAEKLEKEFEAVHTERWQDLRDYITSSGLGGDWYSKDKYHMHFDTDLGILIACDEKHGSAFDSFLAGLVK